MKIKSSYMMNYVRVTFFLFTVGMVTLKDIQIIKCIMKYNTHS